MKENPSEYLPPKYRAPALDKGLDILELLAASPSGLSQVEISSGLGRATNEIFRMLDTLVRRNYVTRTADGDRYTLSLKLLILANMHPPRRRILDIAEPLMRKVTRESEQSCQLALWEDGDVVISSAFSAPGNWRLSVRTGAVIGLYNTSSGKVLVAFQPPGISRKMIAEHQLVKGEERMAVRKFEALLQEIRMLGYWSEPSQTTRGIVNLCFPILDPEGTSIAALTCPFLERIDDYKAPEISEVARMFRSASEEIGRQISGN